MVLTRAKGDGQMVSEVVDLTQALIRIPSENPRGSEKEIAAFVADWFRSIPGVGVKVYEVKPGRPNVVATLKGGGKGQLVYLGHMDTVPVGQGWTQDPFGGEIIDNRIYGRGSVDMKGGLAAIMIALKRIANLGSSHKKDFVVCATVDEEGPDMLGALDLIERKLVRQDATLVATEPTGLKLAVAHKGVVWYGIEIYGKNAHAGNPHVGVDAIMAMGQVITAIKNTIHALEYESKYLGKTSIAFGKIQGGEKTNVVSDYVRCEVDIRIVKPMTIANLTELLHKTVAHSIRGTGATFKISHINIDRPPVEAPIDSSFVKTIRESYREVSKTDLELFGFPAYTDASIISARMDNPNCYLFGPGALTMAHVVDECVAVSDLEKAADVLTTTAREYLNS